MEKLFFLVLIFSIIDLLISQKTCDDIIKLKISEDEMISQFEENMLDIKKDSDK